jgi:hypothetical protein
MFKKLGIPLDNVPLALTALAKDSQQKFFGKTDGKKSDVFTADQWARVDNIFKELNIPFNCNMSLEEFSSTLQNARF